MSDCVGIWREFLCTRVKNADIAKHEGHEKSHPTRNRFNREQKADLLKEKSTKVTICLGRMEKILTHETTTSSPGGPMICSATFTTFLFSVIVKA